MTAAWLGWRDIASRPARALIALAVVAGCAAVFAFTELNERVHDADVAEELDRVAAPLRIVATDQSPAGAAPRLLDAADESRVRAAAAAAVRDVESWLVFDVDIGGVHARLVGAPSNAPVASTLTEDAVALGAVLAERLGVRAGSRLIVAGQPRRVLVLAPFGSPDDAAAFVTLDAARHALGVPSAVSELRVRLWPAARVEEVKRRLTDALPHATVLRVDRGSVADVEIARAVGTHHLGIALATALAALACLAIAAVLDASERRLELASLVALGATRGDVVVALAARSAVIAVLGAAGGALGGTLAAAAMGDATAVARGIIPVFALTTAVAVILGVGSSMPAGILAAWRDPVRDLQNATA